MTVVANEMSTDVLTCEPDDGLRDAAKRMADRGVGSVLILEGDRLAGILTERDLLKAVAAGSPVDAPVSEWMTRNPETIESEDSIGHAGQLMVHGGFRHLPVVEGDSVIGVVSMRDLSRARSHGPAVDSDRRQGAREAQG